MDRSTMILQTLTSEIDHFMRTNADAQNVFSVYMLLPKEVQEKARTEIFEAARGILMAKVSG